MVEITTDAPELTALRAAVRQIVDRYGFSYFLECARAHKEPTELYREELSASRVPRHAPAGGTAEAEPD